MERHRNKVPKEKDMSVQQLYTVCSSLFRTTMSDVKWILFCDFKIGEIQRSVLNMHKKEKQRAKTGYVKMAKDESC